MLDILVTLEVLNLETSKEVKEEQLKNISFIYSTFEVSKLDISNETNDIQL